MPRANARDARYDVIIAGDLTTPGDRSLRIALEVEHYRAQCAKVGLFHAGSKQPGRPLAAELAACVRRGGAIGMVAGATASCRLLIIHAPSELDPDADLSCLSAGKLITVVYQQADYAPDSVRKWARCDVQHCAPVSRTVRRLAPSGVMLTRGSWRPPVVVRPAASLSHRTARHPLAIGWLTRGSAALPAFDATEREVFAISLDGSRHPLVDEGRVIDVDGWNVAPSRLLERFAAFAFFPDEDDPDPGPEALIARAIDLGRPVALPSHLEARVGPGPIYCAQEEAITRLTGAMTSNAGGAGADGSSARPTSRALPVVRGSYPERSGDAVDADGRPVLFVVGGSTGIGHTTRLLAIARRMRPGIPVIFACQAHTLSAIEKFGYVAEHIPSASYTGAELDRWNDWLRQRIDQLLDEHDPSLVVFDGNHLYPGLARSIASRPDCRLAWVRRGLWGKTQSPYIANTVWCDLVIEPGELPGQPDEGITALRKVEALGVDPIRLVDHTELLSRADACAALGLDPKAPAVILQLGANSVGETVSILRRVLDELQKQPKLQICVAEFDGLEPEIGYFPGVIYVRGFPLSQYLRAFDFAISAAGYNTFHEAIGLNLPTIFIPNRDPTMDDQAGRATFAQDRGAAFEIDADDLSDLPNLVHLLLEPKGRNFLSQNCQSLRRPNGAIEAARALERLAS